VKGLYKETYICLYKKVHKKYVFEKNRIVDKEFSNIEHKYSFGVIVITLEHRLGLLSIYIYLKMFCHLNFYSAFYCGNF
jgi:hypothetical protein